MEDTAGSSLSDEDEIAVRTSESSILIWDGVRQVVIYNIYRESGTLHKMCSESDTVDPIAEY